MAKYDLRILLETVEGKKTSYFTSGSSYGHFIDTSNELVLSSSKVYGRITASVSCSYQNQTDFTGVVNTNHLFKNNILLSSSLDGLNTGSINFTALDNEYDRLLRYKFIGEKVCHVLGLPSSQWIYVDQLRLPADDEANYIEGNLNAKSIHVSDKITFANTSNMNSDITFLIDTGSDRHIKFVETSNIFENALLIGYDIETDRYEISASANKTFHIKNVDKLESIESIDASSIDCNSLKADIARLGATADSDRVLIFDGEISIPTSKFINVHDGTSGDSSTVNNLVSMQYVDSSISGNEDAAPIVFRAGNANEVLILSQSKVGININGGGNVPDSLTHELTVVGDIKATGDVIANRYVTSESISVVNTSSGSNVFGNSADDVHKFIGSLSGSNGFLNVSGEISASDLTLHQNNNAANETVPVLRLRNDALGASATTHILFETGSTSFPITNDSRAFEIKHSSVLGVSSFTNYVSTGRISFETSGSTVMSIKHGGTNNLEKRVGIGTINPASTLEVIGDISASGEVSANTIVVGSTITHIGDSNTKITFDDDGDDINLTAAGKTAIDITYDGDGGGDTREITFNEGGEDFDVRIEGADDANLFFTNAGTDKVGVGTNAPRTKLHVDGDITAAHITASNNISASGTIFGKQHYFTHHNFNGTTNKMFLPINSTSDGDSIIENRKWLAPYDGELKKLLYRSEEAVGNNSASLHINGTVAGTSDTVNMNSADTTFTLTFSSNNSFNAGDELSVSVDPASDTNDTNITCVWLYTIGE